MELFIPTRIRKDAKFGKGFGSKDFKRTLKASLIGFCFFSLPLGLFFFNKNIQTFLLAVICITGVIVVFAYISNVRDSINLSLVDRFKSLIAHITKQQKFLYRKLEEWK